MTTPAECHAPSWLLNVQSQTTSMHLSLLFFLEPSIIVNIILPIILWELKYKLQIERMICNGTNNDEFLFIYNAL